MYNPLRKGIIAQIFGRQVALWKKDLSVMANVVQDKMVISLAYTLKLANGEVIDYSEAGEPLEYLHGAGNIIPGLERALVGMKVGDSKDVEILPEEGYGEYDPDDIEEIDIQEFPPDFPMELGAEVPVSDEEGNMLIAYVREITADHVTLDFNHLLAGKKLFFSVEIVGVRDATEEELEHGHPHGFDDEYDEYEEDFDDDDDFEDEDDLPSALN
jgi:FKBP-type peptidyl-prolyl cis-trans isomerase SlyD